MAATLPTLEEIEATIRRVVREELAANAGPEVMTVEQAAAYTGRAAKTIRGWLLAGLPSARKGRRVHIRRSDLDEWMTRPETCTDALVASLRRAG